MPKKHKKFVNLDYGPCVYRNPFGSNELLKGLFKKNKRFILYNIPIIIFIFLILS